MSGGQGNPPNPFVPMNWVIRNNYEEIYTGNVVVVNRAHRLYARVGHINRRRGSIEEARGRMYWVDFHDPNTGRVVETVPFYQGELRQL